MRKRAGSALFIFSGLAALLFLASLLPDNKQQQWTWTITATPSHQSGIPWSRFFWEQGNMGKKHYDKTAMFIPVQLEGSPYYFNFQFDLGADITMLYGKNVASISKQHPEINLKNPVFHFGDFTALYTNRFYSNNYGGKVRSFDTLASATGADLGTIGVDMFQNKVVIIDYPNERFSISEDVPPAYQTKMTGFTLDSHNRVILPMTLRGKHFRVLFDNGSSIFQLITSSENISKFSTEPVVDKMKISAWGKLEKVTGRPLNDEFTLAGQTYSHILVYENPSSNLTNEEFDAITGNALFFDKVVIIDFKNKQFGIKTP